MNLAQKAILTLGALVATAATASAADADWTNRFSVSGQLDVRMERDMNTFYTSPSGGATGTGDDLYTRVRARLLMGMQVNDVLKANVRLATGRNQYTTWATLGQASDAQGGTAGFSERKDFMLDYAYLSYTGFQGLEVQLGKNPIMFWTPGGNEMVWNLANSTEGLNAVWKGDMGSLLPWAVFNYSTVLNKVNGTPTQAGATDGADINLLALQLGLTWKTDGQWATLALGNYEYNNIQGAPGSVTGQTSPVTGIAGNGPSMGNSVDGGGAFLNNYNMIDAGVEYGRNFGALPVKVYGEYVQNTMVSTNNVGTIGGVTVGSLALSKMAEVGSWNAMATYRDVRADATVGAYGDIAFLNGSTGVFGAEYAANYQAWSNAAVGVVYDNGRKNISSNGGYTYEIYMLTMYSKF